MKMAATVPVKKSPLRSLFVILLFICGCFASKLNVPKLLLPYHSAVSTTFTLVVSEGCYTWRSQRPEIASVAPVGTSDHEGCSSRAVVTATSRVPTRKSTIVVAEDPVTGQQLQCDVIVDDIASIDIETTTKELYLDNSPEEFEVRAMNDRGSVFSSLEGVSFSWNLLSDTDTDQAVTPAHNILRLLKYSESSYKALPWVRELEDQGRRGFRVLIKGIRTGSAIVSVRLVDPVYKTVKEATVRIAVFANLQLTPPVVYLLQFMTVRYGVELLKQGQTQKISMPSSQYYLELEDPKIGSLDSKTSTVTALEFGDTEIKLKDRNIKLSGNLREPTAGIYVVNPGYIEFSVLPDGLWILQTGKVYEIFINAYDKESHHIYPSANLRIDAIFPTQYFKVTHSSVNGTYHIVETLERGFPNIDGELRAVVRTDGTEYLFNPPIEGTQDVEIFDPVKVKPKELYLPWVPDLKTTYKYPLTATGGSGNYSWQSSESRVATVNTRGEVSMADVTGDTKVTVSDTRNAAHYDTMQVHVLTPSRMEFLPSRVEAEIGTELDLPLAVYGSHGDKLHTFNLCDRMPFSVYVTDNSIFKHMNVKEPGAAGGCASVHMAAKTLGHTEVRVTYVYKDVKLQATVTIAAYKPLQPFDPEKLALVTPAASKEMIFTGGPQPWVLDTSQYFQKVSAERPGDVSMAGVQATTSLKNQHVLRVSCLRPGEQELSIQVGNGKTAKNQFPAMATASVRFACAEPKNLKLVPHVTLPDGLPPCPINFEFDEVIPVHNYRNLEMLVTVSDEQGRSFDNFSSLVLDWSISDQHLASLSDKTSVTTETEMLDSGRRKIKAYKMILMNGKTGELTVTAAITGYNRKYLTSRHQPGSLAAPISKTRVLSLVMNHLVHPEYLTVYNHATIKPYLNIDEGSGHFHMEHGATNLAQLKKSNKQARVVEVVPLEEGTFSVVTYDLCLDSPSARSTIFISDVFKILLTVVDKVELTKEIEARVQIMDRNNQVIPVKYFPLMNLQSKTGSDIISLRSSSGSGDSDTAVYTVRGVALGRTELEFTARQQSGRMVHSPAREIQVFPPLRLDPRNITLLVGAIFQVTAHGGPQPQSTIEFSIKNDTVATVSGSGLVEAAVVGTTTVVGRAVGVDTDSGVVVYSQDQVTINVVELQGIRIFAPLKRLQTGTEMPVYAIGVNENEAPFSFGSAMPPLEFRWSISNKEVAELKPLLHKSGIRPSPESNFAVRFFAEEAGHVTVTLHVSPFHDSKIQVKNNAKLTDSVQIQVFEKLQLVSPKVCDGQMVITPNTNTKVKTNRDGSSARVTYTVVSNDPKVKGHDPVIEVSEGGMVGSGAHSGKASLLITSHEDFGVNQSLVILVQVKPISYLMLNADTVIHTRGPHLATIPVGSVLHFSVSFHDDVGHKFYATNSKIRYRPNRFDLLQLSYGNSNNTLVARATNQGQTVLKIWDKLSPQMSDYVNIEVGVAVQPSDLQVNLGDIICFHSPVVSNEGHPGVWYTTSPILQVDQSSGVALAAVVGHSSIAYNVSSSLVTHAEINVAPIHKVTLRNDHISFLSNVATKNSAKTITVLLEDDSGLPQSGNPNLHGPNCSEIIRSSAYSPWKLPFRCTVSMESPHRQLGVEDIVSVTAEFDPNSGQYQCRVSQLTSSSQDILQMTSSHNTNLLVQALVPERDTQGDVSSNSVKIPYIPAFYIHTSEVHLSNLVPSSHLRISATQAVLDDLKIMADDDGLVSVKDMETSQQTDYVAQYPIALQLTASLWERSQLETIIHVHCISTGQTQKVPVRIKLVGQQGDHPPPVVNTMWGQFFAFLAANYPSIILLIFIIIFTILCVIIGYQAILGSRYQAAGNQSGVFISPGQTPGSPGMYPHSHMGSPYNLNQSPQRLWSVDYGPYDSSGIFKRSPTQRSPTQ